MSEGTDAEFVAAANLVSSRYAPVGCGDLWAAVEAAGFSAGAYFAANPDLRGPFSDAQRAGLHFLAMARTERRVFPIELNLKGLEALLDLSVADRGLLHGLVASLVNAWMVRRHEVFETMLERIFPHVAALRGLGAAPYVLIGDSHSTLYRRGTARTEGWLMPLHMECHGGSAIGLFNPMSRSGYRERIRRVVARLGVVDPAGALPVLFQFGQVDLEFVQPFRRLARGGVAFDAGVFRAFCRASVDAYVGFLAEAFPRARRSVVRVLGVFPPALADDVLRAGYVNGVIAEMEGTETEALRERLAGLEWPDLVGRTALHAEYNAMLEATSGEAGLPFVSDFGRLAAGGVIDPQFTSLQKGADHHMDFEPTESVLGETVWGLVASGVVARAAPVVEKHAGFLGRFLGGGGSAPVTHPLPLPRREGGSGKISFADLCEELDPMLLPRLDRPGVDEAGLTPAQLEWRRDGVVTLRGFLPEGLIDAYVARRAENTDPGGWSLPTPYMHVAELRDLALYPPLLAMMEGLIGEPMLLHLALTGWRSTQRAWHQDDYLNLPCVSSWYAAVWMALGDVGPECGPFEYLPGSHRWPLMRLEKVKGLLTGEELARREPKSGNNEWPKYAERFVTPAVEAQIAATGLPVRQFLAKKGDVLIWHGRLMHQGSLPIDPAAERRSLITHYSGVNHRPDMVRRARTETGGEYALFDHPLR